MATGWRICCVLLGVLVLLPIAHAAPAQDQVDEYRDGPGLQILNYGFELPYGTSPDRIVFKVKNTGTQAVTAFSYDIVVFDQNRTDIVSNAKTFSVKKTIKPGDSKEVECRTENMGRDRDNTTIRLIKITYADGTIWDRFEKKQ